MVLYHPHTLIQMSGRLAASQNALTSYPEIWSASLRGRQDNNGADEPVQDLEGMLQGLGPTLGTLFASVSFGVSALATLDVLKINNINEDGHYASNVTHQYNYSSLVRGGVTPTLSTLPMFVTCTGTLLTDSHRGRASRGRITLPWSLSAEAPGSSSMLPASQQTVASSVQALIQTIKPTPVGIANFVPMVVSSLGGEWSVIRSVRVGHRFDTLNRRKNAIPEAPYVTSSV
jgi:hypothetical protein